VHLLHDLRAFAPSRETNHAGTARTMFHPKHQRHRNGTEVFGALGEPLNALASHANIGPSVTDTPALYTDRSKPPKLYHTPDPITGKRRERVAIRTKDLDEATLALLLNVEVPKASKALNYLMDETETGRS
jgi:hypothetical protein